MKVFIDSNLPMYVAGKAHPHRDAAKRFLRRVQSGEVDGYTSTEVLQEILYRYTALGRRDFAREVYQLFVAICPVVLDVTIADTDRAVDLLLEYDGISARDAVHAGVMLSHGIDRIATFDRDFDRIREVRRLSLR